MKALRVMEWGCDILVNSCGGGRGKEKLDAALMMLYNVSPQLDTIKEVGKPGMSPSESRKQCSTWNIQQDFESFESACAFTFEKLGLNGSSPLFRKFYNHFSVLRKWNEAINLTRISTTDAAAIELYCDSSMLSTFLPAESRLLDVGSGGGFPGIVLAFCCSKCSVCLLESRSKKVEFLRYAVRELGLEDRVSVLRGRWPDIGIEEPFDVICSKATFSNPMKLFNREDLLSLQGTILIASGEGSLPDREGFDHSIESYRLPNINHTRFLHCYRKEGR